MLGFMRSRTLYPTACVHATTYMKNTAVPFLSTEVCLVNTSE